jgi:hypothetical protein
MASASVFCLSAIEIELSIMKSRSILSTPWLLMVFTETFVVLGVTAAMGLSMHPVLAQASAASARVCSERMRVRSEQRGGTCEERIHACIASAVPRGLR